MYRRAVQGPVRRGDVLEFLFKSREFPRAFYHSLGEVESCLGELPRNESPLRSVAHLQRLIQESPIAKLKTTQLHGFIDDLQLELYKLHDVITDTYFRVNAPVAAASA